MKALRCDLRPDQWDLVVLSLEHVMARIDETSTSDPERIHRLTRKFTRRRVEEVMNDIKAQVPEAGQ